MGIFSRWFRRNRIKNQLLETDEWTTLASWLGIDLDNLNLKGENALKEITVYTCIKILSETLSKLPLKVYQDNNGIRKAADHYLYPMLKLRPNPYMSASDFWKTVEAQRNLYGNAYVWIEFITVGRNAGRIKGLYPLDSKRMQVYVDDVGLLSSQNSVWYIYTDQAGNQYKLQYTDLLHFKGLTTNGLVGLGPIQALSNSIENAGYANQFLHESYKNGMQTKGIIQYVGDLDEKAKQKFREKFEEMSNGLKNANRISLLPIGYKFQPIALSFTDAQFLENTKLTIQQIAAAFGVKLHQINDLVKSSYASTSEANREFYMDTLMAILNMYEQELTYKLFLDSEIMKGYYAKFKVDVILRADPKTRAEIRQIDIQSGHKTINETRAEEELPPLPGGDTLIVNGNMIPVEMAGAQYTKGGETDG